jgi:hypothetical protein
MPIFFNQVLSNKIIYLSMVHNCDSKSSTLLICSCEKCGKGQSFEVSKSYLVKITREGAAKTEKGEIVESLTRYV